MTRKLVLGALLGLTLADPVGAAQPEGDVGGGGDMGGGDMGGGDMGGGDMGGAFGGASAGRGGSSLFGPPSGATFTPDTSSDPGYVDGARTRAADQRAGAIRHGEATGYDIIDAGQYTVDAGWDATMPEYHVVVKGDTLWDICAYYFRDAYLWPRVWSYNDQITNAHWIFPGDRVRLTDPYGRDVAEEEASIPLSYSETYTPPDTDRSSYMLSRYAYITEDQFETDMEIIGGASAKVMMSTLDTAYASYKPERPPVAGERLSVYQPRIPIHDIEVRGKKQNRVRKGDRIGWLVEVVGEVHVQSIARKSAEATVVDALQPVERGQKVGELQTRFSRITPTDAEVTDNGLVVYAIRELTLNGEEQFVVTNLGADRGVRRGNVLEVVRKGDEYTSDHLFKIPYEEGHPRRILGTVLIVQVEQGSSLGVVTFSRREIVKGDHVEIRVPGASAATPALRGGMTPESSAGVRAGEGRVEGSAGFKLGK
jgi:hypothetical protein